MTDTIYIAAQTIQDIQSANSGFSWKEGLNILFAIINIAVLCVTAWYVKKSPIDAVKVGRELNEKSAKYKDKRNLFLTLFSNRGQYVNQWYVSALNQIDVVFHDTPSVLEAWHELYDALNQDDLDEKMKSDEFAQRTIARWDNLRRELLIQVATAVGYDLHQIKHKHLANNAYSPKAHENEEQTNRDLKTAAIQYLLSGNNTHLKTLEFYDFVYKNQKPQTTEGNK